MKARYYADEGRRFLAQDPAALYTPTRFLEDPQQQNLYSYVANNPLKYVDPSGESLVLAAIVAAAVVAEIGLTTWDAVDLLQTLRNPEATDQQKAATVGLFWLGVVAPGGGYTKADDAASLARRAARQGDEVLNATASKININQKQYKHVLDRHVPGGTKVDSTSSIFNDIDEVEGLIKGAEGKPIVQQGRNRYQTTYDAGRNIGVDVKTGEQTSVVTVITNKQGDLTTSFPGTPN